MKRSVSSSFIASIFLLCLFGACENPVSYSPFEANVAERFRNTTQKNLLKIAQLNVSADQNFNVALISDIHYHYENLKDALVEISKREDVAFIIVTGDITENGLQKEFELFHRIMERSNKPYLTLIGNHDYLSNGGRIYQQMFGPLNYSFTFQNIKFVMWDNVLWESAKIPDWTWFEKEIEERDENGSGLYHHVIPFSHIPPFDKQLSEKAELFHELLRVHNIKTSIHGHKHEYFLGELFGDGVNYVTVGSPQHRSYALLSITPSEVVVNKLEY